MLECRSNKASGTIYIFSRFRQTGIKKKYLKPSNPYVRHYQIEDATYFEVHDFEVQIYNRALFRHFYGIFLKAHHWNLNHGFWYPQIIITIHKNHSISCLYLLTYVKWNVKVYVFTELWLYTAIRSTRQHSVNIFEFRPASCHI